MQLAGRSNSSNLTIGTKQLATAGMDDLFVTTLNAAGAPWWSARLGGKASDHYSGLLFVHPPGLTVLLGRVSGGADYGGKTINPDSGYRSCVLGLAR